VAATPSVKVTKSFSFKEGTRLWSNRYHFNGGTPSDNTHWDTLFDAIVAAEKLIYSTLVTIVDCTAYAAGSDVPVHNKSYAQHGTRTITSGNYAQGQSAAIIRYGTTARTSKNHPIYLFNYYHGVYNEPTGIDSDRLNLQQKGYMATYAAAWIAGFSDGTITAVRAGPNGATATGSLVEEYISHRDFPYTRSV
jgi:hypothetical protein